MTILLNRFFSSVVLGHFIVDVMNSQVGILLAFLSVPLGLSNALIGLINTAYQVITAFAQPFFGYFADRIGTRWVTAGGVLWMGVFFSLAMISSGNTILVFLIIAALGSGAFHPCGSAQAARVVKTHFPHKITTGVAFFFVAGNMGYFIGPILGGVLLFSCGLLGLLPLSLLALPIGFWVAAAFQPRIADETKDPTIKPETRKITNFAIGYLLALFATIAMQSWTQSNISTFLPKFMNDLGYSPALYGFLVSLFSAGSAVGNIIGGGLADRFGKQKVVILSMALATIPLLVLAVGGYSILLYVAVPLAGILNGASFSVLFVSAQRINPSGEALTSGLILGFVFSSGALGAWLSGILADHVGIIYVFYLTALLTLLGGFFGLRLRNA